MPRNPIERELLVDFFDDQIAYAYAHAHQCEVNDHLERLAEMAKEIADEARVDQQLLSLPGGALTSVGNATMNWLKSAVKYGDVAPDTGKAEWLNFPANGRFDTVLSDLQVNPHGPWMLIQALSANLERTVPDAMKPFTTQQQVLALTERFVNENRSTLQTTLHLPSFAVAVHTAFIERHTHQHSAEESEDLLRNALELYRQRAYQAGISSITSAFSRKMTMRLYERAAKLDISIDRFYAWGSLISRPRSAKKMLADFAALISLDPDWFKKWAKEKVEADLPELTANEFIRRALAFNPRVQPRSSSGPIYFSSAHSDITIRGASLQNRLALVLPYDQPFPELDRALARFKKYFERRSAQHRADLQEPEAFEAATAARRKSESPEPKVERVIIENVRSIPVHLAALRTFEPDNPAESRKPATSLYLNIHDEIASYGFTIGTEATRASVQNANKHRNSVMLKLNTWIPPEAVGVVQR
ncbi:hypothetical protein [Paraburkholderia sp. MM6662-R1]|uniref:hypothetical protein n=1 Tax=Paraburkholderia sp. MM6662-R1 TaxID=2991066 RepID=UPI003D1CDD64